MKYIQKLTLIALTVLTGCAAKEPHYYHGDEKRILIPVEHSLSRNVENIQYYMTPEGLLVGVTTRIIVKLSSQDVLEKYLDEFNLTVQEKFSDQMYLLKASSFHQTLEIANALSKKTDVLFAHPDFIKEVQLR